MKEIKYEYRILKLSNGLGEIGYNPEVRRKNNIIDRFFNYINGDNSWKELITTCNPSVRNEEQRYIDALNEITNHKQANIWIKEIIKL